KHRTNQLLSTILFLFFGRVVRSLQRLPIDRAAMKNHGVPPEIYRFADIGWCHHRFLSKSNSSSPQQRKPSVEYRIVRLLPASPSRVVQPHFFHTKCFVHRPDIPQLPTETCTFRASRAVVKPYSPGCANHNSSRTLLGCSSFPDSEVR